MPDAEKATSQFDQAWKVALEIFFRQFLALCFPAAHDLIDWLVAPVFLDTELPKIASEHAHGPRSVDKLVKVRLLDGREEWLFIHIEVQAQPQAGFPLRMWVYYCRLWDKYGERVVSLAVLADDDPNWRPHGFETETAGCRLRFEFPTFKVLDFADAEAVFARTRNPIALVLAAHQVALATKQDSLAHYEGRFRLGRFLRRHGLEREEVKKLWQVMYTLTRLPEDLELRFKTEFASLEQTEPGMPLTELITPLEEIAMAKGEAKGLAEGSAKARQQDILDALEVRLRTVPGDLRKQVEQIADESRLRRALRLAITEPSLQAFLANL
jgi:hypothetical protein